MDKSHPAHSVHYNSPSGEDSFQDENCDPNTIAGHKDQAVQKSSYHKQHSYVADETSQVLRTLENLVLQVDTLTKTVILMDQRLSLLEDKVKQGDS